MINGKYSPNATRSDGSCFITIKLDEIEAEQIFSNALKEFVLEEKSAEAPPNWL